MHSAGLLAIVSKGISAGFESLMKIRKSENEPKKGNGAEVLLASQKIQ
jgi:hypothetical protein